MAAKPPKGPDYDVGYRRPPKHSRFKPGESGNPAGRKPRSRNFKTILVEVFEERIEVREGDRVRRMPRFEAILRVNSQRALKGDTKALAMLFSLAKQVGYGAEAASAAKEALDGLDHEAVIAEWQTRETIDVDDGDQTPEEPGERVPSDHEEA